jgi:hypothetical protein
MSNLGFKDFNPTEFSRLVAEAEDQGIRVSVKNGKLFLRGQESTIEDLLAINLQGSVSKLINLDADQVDFSQWQ